MGTLNEPGGRNPCGSLTLHKTRDHRHWTFFCGWFWLFLCVFWLCFLVVFVVLVGFGGFGCRFVVLVVAKCSICS